MDASQFCCHSDYLQSLKVFSSLQVCPFLLNKENLHKLKMSGLQVESCLIREYNKALRMVRFNCF